MHAPGAPGLPPWTALPPLDGFVASPLTGAAGRTWLGVAAGAGGPIYHRTFANPAVHSLEFLVAAPGAPPIEPAKEASHDLEWPDPERPVLRTRSRHAEYALACTWSTGALGDGLLVSGEFAPELPDLRLHVLLHLGGTGWTARRIASEPPLLAASGNGTHLALVGGFDEASAAYANASDVRVDLYDNDGSMEWIHDEAGPGSVALSARIAVATGPFQVAIGFGADSGSAEEAGLELLRLGASGVAESLDRALRPLPDLARDLVLVAADGGRLARASISVLRALEERPGAYAETPGAEAGDPLVVCEVAGVMAEAGDREAAHRAVRELEARSAELPLWAIARTVLLAGTLAGHPAWDEVTRDAVRRLAVEVAPGMPDSNRAVCARALRDAAAGAAAAGDVATSNHLASLAEREPDRILAGSDPPPGADGFHPSEGLLLGVSPDPARPSAEAHVRYLRSLVAVARPPTPAAHRPLAPREVAWTAAWPLQEFEAGTLVTVQMERPGAVVWTPDGWRTNAEIPTRPIALGLHVATLPTGIMRAGAELEWTVRFEDGGWLGTNQLLRAVAVDEEV